MTGPRDLTLVQLDFARALTAPGAGSAQYIDARLRSDLGIPASGRMRVYANACFARMHDVLREDYAALHSAIGADAFHDLAKLYLLAHPSRSFTLRVAGARLPDFLRGPVAEPFSRRWPFAADLAELEWALVDVFDAPDALPLERAALAGLAPEAWSELRLALVPAHRLLALDWPVQRIRDAASAGDPIPSLDPVASKLLIHRRDELVFKRALSETEFHALERIQAGQDFGAVCAAVAERIGEDSTGGFALACLELWLAEGLIAGLVLGS